VLPAALYGLSGEGRYFQFERRELPVLDRGCATLISRTLQEWIEAGRRS
jgi:hypothetical protein